ncbi:MAG: AAA family ATPase, partial [Deltaproteobacteria bacterium]|nr:AAA family ATPase [Deltaproteobacteria bacterium]
MFLKRLEIVGFKSFTERTTVEFSPGISAVVGPNGCGKSNIIDAIRWVMGEQNPRLLRTRNMEDLLFNGSVSRLPASMAEVTLTMVKDDPNRGDAQVSVTRSLYRAGDSEYMINRMPCRLKDVIRFFIEAGMGTKAYNIIEQEKVGRLIDAPPEERRLLIDEAAGITRYKEQRKESERRLDRAEQNLETLSVLMGEAGKRLAVVSKAAAKAQRWLALRAELKGLELVVSARRFLELSRNHGELLAQAQSLRDELATVEANCSQIELEADSLRLSEASQGQALENALNEFHGLKSQTDKWALEIGHLESDMEAAESSRQAALDDLANLDEESERHLGETRRLEESAANLRAESAEAEETRRELRERWVAIKAECDKLAQSRDLAYQKFFRASDDLARLGEIL